LWLLDRILGWMIGFIDTLYIALGTTPDYSAIAISTLYSSLLHPLVSTVFTSRIMASSVVACWFTAAEMCLTHHCVATHVARTIGNTILLLLRAFASAGMCLMSHCLAMNYSSFQISCHNIGFICKLVLYNKYTRYMKTCWGSYVVTQFYWFLIWLFNMHCYILIRNISNILML
jgi:hypothetical protein